MVCCICQLTTWLASSVQSRSENWLYLILPYLTALLRDVKWIASSVKADWKMICCICQITKWIASSARSSSAIDRSELLVNKIYFTLPNLSALVREAYNVTCLERSKQFGKKRLYSTQTKWLPCYVTWITSTGLRSSEHTQLGTCLLHLSENSGGMTFFLYISI